VAGAREDAPIEGLALDSRWNMSDTVCGINVAVGLQEQLASLRKRRRSVDPREMHALLTEAGFERRYGKGDHWVYTHPHRPFPLTIDPRNPLLPVYVSHAIRAIEEVLADEDS
jgi:predicted RNA binding protein YcfA (HicA-like mRNA interferase family)